MGVERVLIVGAGIGGLSLAIALGRRGVKADVVEIKPDNAVQGLGISIPSNGIRALDQLGVFDKIRDVCFVFDSFSFFDAAGNTLAVAEMPRVRDDGLPSYIGLPRPAYAEILTSAAHDAGATITCDASIASMKDGTHGVTVTFADGHTSDYDVVVGADGVNSAMRRQLFGDEWEPIYSGVAVWRVEVPRPREVTYLGTYQGHGSKAGFVPINEDTAYMLLLDVAPESQPENLGHDPSRLYEVLRSRLAEYGGAVGRVRDELAPDARIFYGRLERVTLPLPWHSGRVVLMGDAAHCMSPNISQGGTSALEDALVLAEELTQRDSVEIALSSYGERRYPRAKMFQDISHRMLMDEMSTDPEVAARRAADTAAAPSKFRELSKVFDAPI